MHIKRFPQRAKLGINYVRKSLLDEFFQTSDPNYVPAKPVDVGIEISYLCNLECPTCFRWTSKPDEHELTAEEWKRVLAKLKFWLGTFSLWFTGGEPFLRKDILEIFKFASENSIVTGVVSNGSLIDKTLAKKIIESGLDALTLSLNSMIPEIHNRTRGTSGAFNEVMTAIDNLKDRKGMRLSLSTTIVKDGIGGLIDIIEFARAKGIYGVNFQPIMPATILPVFNKDGEAKKSSVGTPYRELLKGKEDVRIDSVFNRLLSMKEQGYPILNTADHLKEIAKYLKDPTNPEILEKVCTVGVKNFSIDPFGNVRLCSIMEVVGNITKQSPAEIWRSAQAAQQRDTILKCDKTCRLMFCNFKQLDFKYKAKRVING
jgi:MoaA/NifB/PqqE/SkfB family radical SAM enzyme